MGKFFFPAIILAFIIRILLMPISAHSDILLINVFPNLLLQHGTVDIYSYINQNVKLVGFQYYYPLTYYSFAFFQFLYALVDNSFAQWMNALLIPISNDFFPLDYQYFTEIPNRHILRDIFIAKTPYLLFDIASVVVIAKFVREKILQKSAIIAWLFNPVLIYGTYIFGQYEIIPTFFILLAFYLLRRSVLYAVFFLGIAMAYKTYPVIYLIPVILIYSKSPQEIIKLISFSFGPYLLFMSPVLLSSWHIDKYTFLPKVYFTNKEVLDGWPLYSKILRYITLTGSYLLVQAVSGILRLKDKWEEAVALGLVSMLLVLTLVPRSTFYYLLWATPLIFLYFKKTRNILIVTLIQAISFASYKLLGPSVQFDLFVPFNAEFFTHLATVNSLINMFIPYRIISTLGFVVFFVTNIYLIFTILLKIIFQSKVSNIKG